MSHQSLYNIDSIIIYIPKHPPPIRPHYWLIVKLIKHISTHHCIPITSFIFFVSSKISRDGQYCPSIRVLMEDDIWIGAFVVAADAEGVVQLVERNDLIYSYFNGVYVINGTRYGRPIYVEQ